MQWFENISVFFSEFCDNYLSLHERWTFLGLVSNISLRRMGEAVGRVGGGDALYPVSTEVEGGGGKMCTCCIFYTLKTSRY